MRALRVLAGDALAVPLADRCADTVFAVHLLEHLPPPAGAVVLAEMLRLARRRVVVAVPYEDEPNPTWGHIRTFDAAALTALGATTGRPFEVTDHHGGWLVVDTRLSDLWRIRCTGYVGSSALRGCPQVGRTGLVGGTCGRATIRRWTTGHWRQLLAAAERRRSPAATTRSDSAAARTTSSG